MNTTGASDYREGIKREVAEIKFLIHDLRVEKFVNNVIHFHVTLNTDLEIFDAEQALAFHSDDLTELKRNAARMRKAFRDYSNAVTNFSPDKTVIATGRKYIETIQETCELVLNPLWGRFDKVISFLPDDSRSVLSRNHYRNTIRWLCGVYYRIEWFFQELDEQDIREEFDVGEDVADYTNNVIYGYIVEKSHSRVEIQMDTQGPAVVFGNKARFRRMYFNLVMNAVDALCDRPVGMIKVRVFPKGDRVHLVVHDNGSGMYAEKVKHLMKDRESLDGELHSLGFIFVRQTVEEWGGDIDVDSQVGAGTTFTIRLPFLADRTPPPREPSKCQKYATMPFENGSGENHGVIVVQRAETAPESRSGPTESQAVGPPEEHAAPPDGPPPSPPEPTVAGREDKEGSCGRIILRDYETSEADYPGCIFAIGVGYDTTLDTFVHKPYEQHWSINHEDLSPMLYDSTIRGRLEQNEDGVPELILKEPHSMGAYFDLKEVREGRGAELYVDMVHDEYILIARKLIATGMQPDVPTHVTSAERYLGDFETTLGPEPFLLSALAALRLSTE